MMKMIKKTTARYKHIGEIFVDLSTILEPPERLSVSKAAEKYRYVYQPGAYIGDWKNKTTYYMVEPMDEFSSKTYSGLIFVGPAQSGKTDALVVNSVAFSIKVEPMDMMVVCPTMVAARDFSMRRIDRLHTHSEKIGEMLLPGAENDNTFDKHYRSGMILSLSWPTPTELAGKPIGRVVLTDRDRMEDDVAGDGEPFDLASKRTTTFGSYAMTVAESSPSREVDNLKWIRTTPHEAPPCKGILALYNRGDRRRWYWPCPNCGEYFEGNFTMLQYERKEGLTNLEVSETTRMVCPHCAHKIKPDDRDEMQFWGKWIKDGQSIDKHGRVFGPKPRTSIASFWLNGVAATFTNWKKLVATYLDAHDEYERTGSEEALKKFYNNDLGEPYYPKSMNDNGRLPETLKARAEPLAEKMVPHGVRFLLAAVDVQKNSFIVQVFGIMPGQPFDTVLIDRFAIRKSDRIDEDGDAEWVKPHAYVEDWKKITEHVIEREYPLDDGSGRLMSIKFTCCDSGGKEGVTTKAYEYYRHLRSENKHRRFILSKGDGTPNQPRTRISYPDSSRRDSKSGARGDVPVLMFNSNLIKDDLDGRLDCIEPTKGMFRFPSWLSDSFFSELCAEIRTPKGWQKIEPRNEGWDLCYMVIGLAVSELVRVEGLNWENPPSWARDWDENDLVRSGEEDKPFAHNIESQYDFTKMGKALA
jgi:phage terminase large subunit GpA-like protein